jgi:hypothetical protein
VPELRQHKWEIFARFLADDHSQSESYELAGYRPSTANASTLANKPAIQQRVAELKEEKLQRAVEFKTRLAALNVDPDNPDPDDLEIVEEIVTWTVAMVQKELWKNARLAQTANEFTAANKSLELLGKSIGMWEDAKKDKDSGSGKPQVSIALIGEATGRLAISGGGVPAEEISPLAPRIPGDDDAEREPEPRRPA